MTPATWSYFYKIYFNIFCHLGLCSCPFHVFPPGSWMQFSWLSFILHTLSISSLTWTF
jgi:hypothetical protein